MREQAFAWRCEHPGCGHRWLASSETPPEQCARCRKRNWNQTLTTAELVRAKSPDLDDRMRVIAAEVFTSMQADALKCSNVPHSVPPTRANVTEREIVADDYSDRPQTQTEKRAAIVGQLSRLSNPGVIINGTELANQLDDGERPF